MPTSDARIFETAWFINQNQPLMEHKVFYAKVDNLLYYVTAHRGPTTDNLVASPAEVKSVILADQNGQEDNSTECFRKLIKTLDTPAR